MVIRYLSGTRMTIAALQPAPICLHHFAQPSTMGASYVQNFLADKAAAPHSRERTVFSVLRSCLQKLWSFDRVQFFGWSLPMQRLSQRGSLPPRARCPLQVIVPPEHSPHYSEKLVFLPEVCLRAAPSSRSA
jgi:hypothetical protein